MPLDRETVDSLFGEIADDLRDGYEGDPCDGCGAASGDPCALDCYTLSPGYLDYLQRITHDCPREDFLEDPITVAYGVSGMVELVHCEFCEALEAGDPTEAQIG